MSRCSRSLVFAGLLSLSFAAAAQSAKANYEILGTWGTRGMMGRWPSDTYNVVIGDRANGRLITCVATFTPSGGTPPAPDPTVRCSPYMIPGIAAKSSFGFDPTDVVDIPHRNERPAVWILDPDSGGLRVCDMTSTTFPQCVVASIPPPR